MDKMDIDNSPLPGPPLWTSYTLKACISRSDETEELLRKVHSNEDHFKCFDVCRQIIIHLAQKYQVGERSVTHALILSQKAVALNGPNGHKTFSVSCPFNSFWICISVVCFSISINFYETKQPRLRDMMYLLKVPYSTYAKKFYKRVQLKFLVQTKWSLFFPTTIDFYDCLKLKATQSDTFLAQTITQLIQDRRVHCILSFCCTEWDMLQYSFVCMAISAIATVIRLKTKDYNPDDGVLEMLVMLLSPDTLMPEITQCSEFMHEKVVAWMPRTN